MLYTYTYHILFNGIHFVVISWWFVATSGGLWLFVAVAWFSNYTPKIQLLDLLIGKIAVLVWVKH